MTLDEAIALRREMMQCARVMAWYAGNKELPSGHRYEAAVIGDHCLDLAREFDRMIREFAEAE